MEIKQFLSSLSPTFERSRIVEDIETQSDVIRDLLAGPLKKLGHELMRDQKFAAPEALQFEELFKSKFPTLRNQNYFSALLIIVETIGENLQYLERQVPVLFAKDVTTETITFRTASVIQLLDLSRFALDFAVTHVGYLMACETAARTGGDPHSTYVEPQLKFLKDNLINYVTALQVLYVPKREFATLLDNIPEITVDPQRVNIVQQTVGSRKLDPFKVGFISTRFNPIYAIRMGLAEYQDRRYKARKEEARMLQLRVLALQESLQGKQDAEVQSRLDYTSGRLQVLLAEISDMEKRFLKH